MTIHGASIHLVLDRQPQITVHQRLDDEIAVMIWDSGSTIWLRGTNDRILGLCDEIRESVSAVLTDDEVRSIAETWLRTLHAGDHTTEIDGVHLSALVEQRIDGDGRNEPRLIERRAEITADVDERIWHGVWLSESGMEEWERGEI